MHFAIKSTVKTSLYRSFEQLRALNRSEIGQFWLKIGHFSVWSLNRANIFFGIDSVWKINLTSWLHSSTVDMISIWYQVCLYSTTRLSKMSIWYLELKTGIFLYLGFGFWIQKMYLHLYVFVFSGTRILGSTNAIIVKRRSRTRPLLHSRWLDKDHYIKTNCNISNFLQ